MESDDLIPPGNDEIKDNQWLGVTVRSQGVGGKVMVSQQTQDHNNIASQRDGRCMHIKINNLYMPCISIIYAYKDYSIHISASRYARIVILLRQLIRNGVRVNVTYYLKT